MEKGPRKLLENQLMMAFQKTINRIAHLKSEKVVIIFLQSIKKYQNNLAYIYRKH